MHRARALRPFYFMVAVWGERFCEYLCDYCIPAFLSPNNIPALATRSKFLIATTEADWARIRAHPVLALLERHSDPVFLEIPPCPPGVSPCVHMGIGHKLATHKAFEDKAYGAVLTPDLIISDGTVAAMQRRAVEGYEVVLTAALRFGEEPLFEHLERAGLADRARPPGRDARPLTASGRQLAHIGIRSFHSESLTYEWDQPYFFATLPSAVWWKVPGEDGIIVHSLSWAPLLFDYGAIDEHDSSVMEEWSIDGDYIHKNFGLKGKVYVVQDSDEVMHITWAPLADRQRDLAPVPEFLPRIKGSWARGQIFHTAYTHPIFDPLKREIVFKPVYWHGAAAAFDHGAWARTEKRAQRILRYYGARVGAVGRVIRAANAFLDWKAATGIMLRHAAFLAFCAVRAALRESGVFLQVVFTPWARRNADGTPSWVNTRLALSNPHYNRAANAWQQLHGDTGRVEDITDYILEHMARHEPYWGRSYRRVQKAAGFALRPLRQTIRFMRFGFTKGSRLLAKLRPV